MRPDEAKAPPKAAGAPEPTSVTSGKGCARQGAREYRIPAGSRWAKLWMFCCGAGIVGALAAGAGCLLDPKRFAFSYLFAFIVALGLPLGALFFILIERLTGAAWSVTVRRLAELFASGFPALAVLFIPVLLSMGSLFPWLHHAGAGAAAETHEVSAAAEGAKSGSARHEAGTTRGSEAGPDEGYRAPDPSWSRPGDRAARQAEALEAREEETLAKKKGFLNGPFFLVRGALYFAVWILLSLRFLRLSTAQDATGDPELTRKAQRFAPIATILFGLSLTFAIFDWVMSLDPAWASTIFGVTFFAGCAVTIFAAITVLAMALRSDGLLGDAVTVEHFHDLGKLLFGFTVFWAYVNFSQFMLIWYAALPEETPFFHLRWEVGSWAYISLTIVFAHFVVPFLLLVSRNVKRRLPLLRIGAVWMLAVHVVDVYWLVMPNCDHGRCSVSWVDFACLVGVLGLYLAVVFRKMNSVPLIPVGDPRLARSLAFENA